MSKKHESHENADHHPYYEAVVAAVLAAAVVGKRDGAVTKEDAIDAYRDLLQALRQRDFLNP